MEKIVIYQPALIAYRYEFFEQLNVVLLGRLEVHAGIQSRESSVKTTETHARWLQVVQNRWILGKQLLFQSGGIYRAMVCRHLVLTLNPRFLHNWLLLAGRSIQGRPTILWGHLHSRVGAGSWTNILRYLQIAVARSLLVYTETERRQFSGIRIKRPCLALGNSCVREADCTPALQVSAEVPRDILYVGRLDRSKKIGILVEAFNFVAQENAQIRLVIVGDGDDKNKLEEQYGDLVAAGRLEFKGWVWDEHILRSFYARALFTVSPGYGGLNIIQSMAYGLPIAVPRGECHSPEIEACVEDFNCLWFKRDDAASLARVIRSFQNNAHRWYQRREEISSWTQRRYTIEHMVHQFAGMISYIDNDLEAVSEHRVI